MNKARLFTKRIKTDGISTIVVSTQENSLRGNPLSLSLKLPLKQLPTQLNLDSDRFWTSDGKFSPRSTISSKRDRLMSP